jgi:hypothetical protein
LGLLDLRARHYDSRIGRFLALDPETGYLPRPITFNRYLFVGADPINLIDPSGRVETVEYAELEAWEGEIAVQEHNVSITIKSQHAWANAVGHNLNLTGMTVNEYETVIEESAREILRGGILEPGMEFRAMVQVVTTNPFDLVFKAFMVTSTWLSVGSYWIAR